MEPDDRIEAIERIAAKMGIDPLGGLKHQALSLSPEAFLDRLADIDRKGDDLGAVRLPAELFAVGRRESGVVRLAREHRNRCSLFPVFRTLRAARAYLTTAPGESRRLKAFRMPLATLAAGIGAIDAVLIDPAPYAGSQRDVSAIVLRELFASLRGPGTLLVDGEGVALRYEPSKSVR